jgi:hypothetical protein
MRESGDLRIVCARVRYLEEIDAHADLEALARAVARRRREGDAKVRLDADPVEAGHEPASIAFAFCASVFLACARQRSPPPPRAGAARLLGHGEELKAGGGRAILADVVMTLCLGLCGLACWRMITMPLVLTPPSLVRTPAFDLGLVVCYECLVLAQEVFVAASVG